jgi:hypothetical protein
VSKNIIRNFILICDIHNNKYFNFRSDLSTEIERVADCKLGNITITCLFDVA